DSRPLPPSWCPPFPYTTLFRSSPATHLIGMLPQAREVDAHHALVGAGQRDRVERDPRGSERDARCGPQRAARPWRRRRDTVQDRSEEHTSELQSRENLVCRLLL